VESLNYLSANPGQKHVVGNKIFKTPEDSEEIEPRSGLSFDVFKLPDAPEQENNEELSDDQEPVPQISLEPQPLNIDNVMRNSRVKFFGVPKLGAYAAVPLSYKSIDHEGGCEIKNDDDGVSFFAENTIVTQYLLGIDTIGKYRRFKVCLKVLLFFV
jgi:hypothetical protein